MKIKTKSGFECNIQERRLKDWRYIKAAAKLSNKDQNEIAEGLAFAVPFLLGDDGEKALMSHVEKDGLVDSVMIIAEFIEITQILGEKVKKSQSSLSS